MDVVQGVDEMLPYFPHSSSDADNVRYTEWAQTFELIFVNIVTLKPLHYVWALMNICPYFAQLLLTLLIFGAKRSTHTHTHTHTHTYCS
jgi:hypothetical protein